MVFLLVLLQIVNVNPEIDHKIAQHDTGNVIMKVTSRCCIGDTVPPSSGNIINGFKYPKTGQNLLFFGGFALGNSITYVADGHYAPGSQVSRDFRTVDSLVRVFRHNAQEWECTYNDSGHPTPKSLRVKQYSICSPNVLYDDGVIMEFTIENEGVSAVNDLYAGLLFDFDWPSNLTGCGSDTIRRCVWMRGNTTDNPTIGVKILDPQSWANLSCIDHDTFVYPWTGEPDSIKYKFLAGIIKKFASTSYKDWSLIASVGPFSLEPAQEYSFAFAVLGGASLVNFYDNADSMQSYYNQISGISENSVPKLEQPKIKLTTLNPVKENAKVNLQISEKCAITLNLYDALGRYLNTIWQGNGPCQENLIFNTQDLPSGLYFIRLTTESATKTTKLIINK